MIYIFIYPYNFLQLNFTRYYGSLIHPKGNNKYCIRIFMELISGNTLNDIIRQRGPLSETVVQSFTKQINEGLEHLHRKNICHRCVKIFF